MTISPVGEGRPPTPNNVVLPDVESYHRLGITDVEVEHYQRLINNAMDKLLVNGEYRTEIGVFGIDVYIGLHGMGRGGFSVGWTGILYWRASNRDSLRYVQQLLEDAIMKIARDLYIRKVTQ